MHVFDQLGELSTQAIIAPDVQLRLQQKPNRFVKLLPRRFEIARPVLPDALGI
jgi:hypothetical protein